MRRKRGNFDTASLESQVQALQDLIEVARSVVSTIDLNAALKTILASAMHFAAAPAGTLAIRDDNTREFRLYCCKGFSADFEKKGNWNAMPQGLTRQVLAAGEIFYIEDVAHARYLSEPVALAEGLKALICIPLRLRDEVLGVLSLGDFVPRRIDREKMKLLSIFASFASMAIWNATLHDRTRIMAITDGLTGLHNHRYFQEMMEVELRRAHRYNKRLAMLMVDVDDFKKYNDLHGHAAGDRILAVIGKIVARSLRKADFAFRYGGEEFIILLPEADGASALKAAERLRVKISEGTAGVVHGVDEGVTVSIGVASYPDDGVDREQLFNLVDELLYGAKKLGKNTCYSRKDRK